MCGIDMRTVGGMTGEMTNLTSSLARSLLVILLNAVHMSREGSTPSSNILSRYADLVAHSKAISLTPLDGQTREHGLSHSRD